MNTYELPRGSTRTPHPDPNTEQQVCQTIRMHCTAYMHAIIIIIISFIIAVTLYGFYA